MSRVEGFMSRVEGNNFYNFLFLKNGNKWKTNKKNLKTNGAWTSPSILVLLVGWGGGEGGGTEHAT